MVKELYENEKLKELKSIVNKIRKEKENRKEGFIIPHLLILGDTGTGKTLLARWLHNHRFGWNENMKDKEKRIIDNSFQSINCGGIPESLMDSELFGGIKGAWTDLQRNVPGKIFSAFNGTLFLDEIGELSHKIQTTLLKFLDSSEYYPVGGHGETIYVPVTIIAATNQPVEKLVEEGKFRRDLYERFRFRIKLPNLRQRMDHFEHLVDFVLQNPQINGINSEDKSKLSHSVIKRISKQAMKKLKNNGWEGNFRELEQVLWKAVLSAGNEGRDIIQHHHINFENC